MNAKRFIGIGLTVSIVAILLNVIVTASKTSIVVATNVGFLNFLLFVVKIIIATGCISTAIGIIMIAIKKAKQSQVDTATRKAESVAEKAEPLTKRRLNVERYLQNNSSTQEFRELLGDIVSLINQFDKKEVALFSMLKNRFDEGTIAYDKFAAPIENLLERILKLIDSLVMRMESFDEEECENKIKRFKSRGEYSNAKEYEDLKQEYLTYVEGVEQILDNSALRLDKLVLEMSKLTDDELERSLKSLNEIETVIKDAQLYKRRN